MKSIYRKSALDKLSSLEQLDKAMKVSTHMSWIALFGIVCHRKTIITSWKVNTCSDGLRYDFNYIR